MRRNYRSIEDARVAFDKYARLEPRLLRLWELCEHAAPPTTEAPDEESDRFAIDIFAADDPRDGWCAEHIFYNDVKSPLMQLVGRVRPVQPNSPPELHTQEAYDEVYDLLLYGALTRTCSCCNQRELRQVG